MRKVLLTMTAAAAMMSATSLTPASAMNVATAPGIEAALADTSDLQDVVYVCRHRSLSSRRVCWWRPGYRHRGWRWRR